MSAVLKAAVADAAPGRHLDRTARMLWLTMSRSVGEWTVAALVYHWRPTFTAGEVDDAVQRLVAAGFARCTRRLHMAPEYTVAGCTPLPGHGGVQ